MRIRGIGKGQVRGRSSSLAVTLGLLVLCFFLWGCQSSAVVQGERAIVAGVSSGQTLSRFQAEGPSALTEEIGLIGVKAPTRQQEPWHTQAKQQLIDWIGTEKTVLLESDLETHSLQQNGSTLRLAYVWQGDRLLNEDLIAAGLAQAEVRSPNLKYRQRLLRAQEKARLLGRGIWNPAHPMR